MFYMIYQLKMTLQRTSPPIWRRILVPKDIVLSELHEIIQIAFDWFGYHLHCFEARTTNGESLLRKNIQIGTQENDDDRYCLLDFPYDERTEKLSNWLVKEKDKLMYVYDFGDDWRHEIVLEKILQPEEGVTYPYCVTGRRAAAEEDSGGFVEETEYEDPEEIKEWLNEEFMEFSKEISSVPVMDQSISESNWKRLLLLAKEYSELAPWQWLTDHQVFSIQHPKTEEYVYCSVMGAMGEEFGLATFHGQTGLRNLQMILDGSISASDFSAANDGIFLSLCHREEMETEDYQLIKREGIIFKEKDKWPMFRSFQPGYYPWYLTEEEVDLFATILERAIVICKRAKDDLHISEFAKNNQCFVQVLERNGDKTVWKDTYMTINLAKDDSAPSKLLVSELEIQRLKSLQRFNVPLEIGVFYSPTLIQENPNERPEVPKVIVIAEREKGMVVSYDLFPATHAEQAIQQAFMKLIDKVQAIPREVWLLKETALILKPIFTKLNISSIEADHLPIIEEIKEGMFGHFRG